MKKLLVSSLVIAVLLLVGLFAVKEMGSAQQRWYNAEQVAMGKVIFRENCSVCHGPSAAATPDWRTADANGNLPPPPLDGSAHTWHHSLSLLQQTVREGGAKLGGTMPPFAEKLTAEEVDAAIAWFQSLWDVEIYTRWSERNSSMLEE